MDFHQYSSPRPPKHSRPVKLESNLPMRDYITKNKEGETVWKTFLPHKSAYGQHRYPYGPAEFPTLIGRLVTDRSGYGMPIGDRFQPS